jgi:hypothetical protein
MLLQVNGIVDELATGQSFPPDGVLVFLDVLLRRATLIIEDDNPLGGTGASEDEPAHLAGGCAATLDGPVADYLAHSLTCFEEALWQIPRKLLKSTVSGPVPNL